MDQSIAQFISLTSASPDQARFFLDSANGDIQSAVEAFYDADGEIGVDNDRGRGRESDQNDNKEELPNGAQWGYTLDGKRIVIPSSGTNETKDTKRQSNSSSRITTFGALSSQHPQPHLSNNGDSESEGEDPLNLFAGGEKSGLSVQNPHAHRRQGDDAPDLVKKILHQAKTEGAARPPSEPSSSGRVFKHGKANTSTNPWGEGGHRLGSEDEVTLSSMPGSMPNFNEESRSEEETVVKRLVFWKDGFSIEDGPLMRYEENQAALQAIQEGRAPLHLLNVRPNQTVEVQVSRRTSENYVPPPKVIIPFSGEGNRLGSFLPPSLSMVSDTGFSSEDRRIPSVQFEVREDEPTTSLQIRLGDGERLVGRFNHSHTIQDVRNYIQAARPSTSTRPWVLMTAFPQKIFQDETQTLKNANLLGAVIVQKYV